MKQTNVLVVCKNIKQLQEWFKRLTSGLHRSDYTVTLNHVSIYEDSEVIKYLGHVHSSGMSNLHGIRVGMVVDLIGLSLQEKGYYDVLIRKEPYIWIKYEW